VNSHVRKLSHGGGSPENARTNLELKTKGTQAYAGLAPKNNLGLGCTCPEMKYIKYI